MILHKTSTEMQKKYALTGIPFLKISKVKHGFKKLLPADSTITCKKILIPLVYERNTIGMDDS